MSLLSYGAWPATSATTFLTKSCLLLALPFLLDGFGLSSRLVVGKPRLCPQGRFFLSNPVTAIAAVLGGGWVVVVWYAGRSRSGQAKLPLPSRWPPFDRGDPLQERKFVWASAPRLPLSQQLYCRTASRAAAEPAACGKPAAQCMYRTA